MTSRFVASGGAEIEEPTENDDWARARKLVEEKKKPQADTVGTQEGGKSLFDHLQAQKAAKQEAFEEATRLRNQFRPLDDSEIEFLESIKRKEIEEAIEARKTTAEQLNAFRQKQAAIESASREGLQDQSTPVESAKVTWTTAKKRRCPQVDELNTTSPVKKIATAKPSSEPDTAEGDVKGSAKVVSPVITSIAVPQAKFSSTVPEAVSSIAKPTPVSILVSYDSDSDT